MALISLLDVPHKHYAETHCGSAAVALNKKPSVLETINDRDNHVINFFSVIRDNPDELIKRLLLTPWSRTEHAKSREQIELLDNIEWARLFYVRVRQGFNSSPVQKGNGWKFAKKAGSKGSHPPKSWKNAVNQLWYVAERLSDFQIENKEAIDFIQLYDSPETLFYVDPPYLKGTRGRSSDRYNHEMSDDQHEKLAETLLNCTGKVLLSGYMNPIYQSVLNGWNCIELGKSQTPSSGRNSEKTEFVWLNYDPPADKQIKEMPSWAKKEG